MPQVIGTNGFSLQKDVQIIIYQLTQIQPLGQIVHQALGQVVQQTLEQVEHQTQIQVVHQPLEQVEHQT